MHVLLCDPRVGQRLIPEGIQGVSDRLRLQLVGLKHRDRRDMQGHGGTRRTSLLKLFVHID